MGVRRKSREAALRILYQCDIHEDWDSEKMAERYFDDNQQTMDEEREFALALANGVAEYKDTIDREMGVALTNWPIERLGYLERNILRIGVFEILKQETTPDKVAVDEAVGLAKVFCETDSSRLINGALQRVMDRKAAGEAPGVAGEKLAG